MFFGDRRPIDPARNPGGTPFYSIHARPGAVRQSLDELNKLHMISVSLSDHLRFRFYSGYTDTGTDIAVNKNDYVYGETVFDPITKQITMNISIEMLQALLRGDLTQAEI